MTWPLVPYFDALLFPFMFRRVQASVSLAGPSLAVNYQSITPLKPLLTLLLRALWCPLCCACSCQVAPARVKVGQFDSTSVLEETHRHFSPFLLCAAVPPC